MSSRCQRHGLHVLRLFATADRDHVLCEHAPMYLVRERQQLRACSLAVFFSTRLFRTLLAKLQPSVGETQQAGLVATMCSLRIGRSVFKDGSVRPFGMSLCVLMRVSIWSKQGQWSSRKHLRARRRRQRVFSEDGCFAGVAGNAPGSEAASARVNGSRRTKWLRTTRGFRFRPLVLGSVRCSVLINVTRLSWCWRGPASRAKQST